MGAAAGATTPPGAGPGLATLPVLILALLLPACAGPSAACRQAGARPALVAELLFGLSRRDGGTVSPADWERFLAGSVTPRFPAGLTVTDAAGQWTALDGRPVREASKRVLIVAPPGEGTVARLQAVRAAYRAAFAQDSVGLVLSQGCAAF